MLSDRLKVAIPLLIVVFLAFFLPGIWGKSAFALLAAAMLFTAVHEGCNLCGMKAFCPQEWLLHAFSVLLIADAWRYVGLHDCVLLMALILLAFALSFRQEVTQHSLETVARTILIGVLVCWPLSFLAKIFYMPFVNAPVVLSYLVVVTKIADIGAYTAGSMTAKMPGGNHKLSPHVSPKKSWEGLAGGIASSLIVSILFKIFASSLHLTWTAAVILGILAATVGLVGDLSESLLKRASGAKDSGKIPGLGGTLDMLDSLLPMGVIFYAWLNFTFHIL